MKLLSDITAGFFGALKKICKAAARLFGRDMTDAQWASVEQFIKFCFVGVSNVLISYAVMCAVMLLIRGRIRYDYLIASVCAFIISVANSFMLNNRYVFRRSEGRRSIIPALLKTYASYAFTGLLLNNLLLYLLCDRAGVSKYIAPVPVMLVTTPVNFLLNKFWAFANPRRRKDRDGGGQ